MGEKFTPPTALVGENITNEVVLIDAPTETNPSGKTAKITVSGVDYVANVATPAGVDIDTLKKLEAAEEAYSNNIAHLYGKLAGDIMKNDKNVSSVEVVGAPVDSTNKTSNNTGHIGRVVREKQHLKVVGKPEEGMVVGPAYTHVIKNRLTAGNINAAIRDAYLMNI